jgi:hypothetical protein
MKKNIHYNLDNNENQPGNKSRPDGLGYLVVSLDRHGRNDAGAAMNATASAGG